MQEQRLRVVQRIHWAALFMLISFFVGQNTDVYAQPFTTVPFASNLPTLSLTGADNAYNDQYYSDGRIWAGYSDDKEREILVPVFMQNFLWDESLITDRRFGGFPIRSFRFSLSYDGRAIKATGVQNTDWVGEVAPNLMGKEFSYEWDDKADSTRFRVYFTGQVDPDTKYGRRITVTGTSTKPLPISGEFDGYEVLCYVRFRVVLSKRLVEEQPQIYDGSDKSPIYVNNDSIFYNNFHVGVHNPFPAVSDGDPNNPYGNKFYRRDKFDEIGLAGITLSAETDPLYPSRPGMIWLNIGENPQVGFQDVVGGTNNEVAPDANTTELELWNITRPIVVDSGSTTRRDGKRDIRLLNTTARSRLYQVKIESDQPWLQFRTLPSGTGGFNPIPGQTRSAVLPYIDNGINGPVPPNLRDANYNIVTEQPEIRFRVVCDPSELNQGNGEYAGIYIGYITITSKSAKISPVRLRVKFIYLRNPIEPGRRPAAGREPGITLRVENSAGVSGDATNIVFGTGHRATDQPDSLFGEQPADFVPTTFFARWYTPWVKDNNGFEVAPNGLGDMPIESSNSTGNRTSSRDIRSNAIDTTLVYLCRFNAGGANNYPVVLSWDTQDFPQDAQLFLRDTLNGSGFSLDMRSGTQDPNNPTVQSFTIRDARWTSFIIEYTLPRVEKFPVIKKGWNFVSLPVRPSDARISRIFPNAIQNTAFSFSQNLYKSEEIARPGYGYFIKYGEFLDQLISGTRILALDGNPATIAPAVRLYSGWNTIGGLSTPLCVAGLSFDPFQTDFPTRIGDVYAYETNRGYRAVSEILPGLGYWLNVDKNGFIKTDLSLCREVPNDSKQNLLENSVQVNVRDNDNKNTTLYFADESVNARQFELPPAPPAELFDVRFSDNTYLTTANSNIAKIQGVTFPVVINMLAGDKSYRITDAEDGTVLGVVSANTSVVIGNSGVRYVQIEEVTTAQAGEMISVTPNPTNNAAKISFVAGDKSPMTVVLIDALGNQVMTIGNGIYSGLTTLEFTTENLVQGQYFVKVLGGNQPVSAILQVVR